MEGEFQLPVLLEGKELELSTKFVPMGFANRFEVTVGEQVFIFEKDDEDNYRVIGTQTDDSLYNSFFESIIQSLKMIAG